MKNCHKKLQIIVLLIAVVLVSACKFPDNVLDWHNIAGYKLDKLKFGITTVDDFIKLTPDAKPESIDKSIIIINTEPTSNDIYKRIRVGFRDKKLDWIDFGIANKIEMSKIIDLYGKPRNINSNYSKTLDYYDYDFFNIATDKKHTSAKSINIFDIPDLKNHKLTVINGIPSLKDLGKTNFLNLKPGITLEIDFQAKYPDLEAFKKDKFDKISIYTLDNELGKAKTYYKKVIVVFNSGLLSWINLIPQSLTLQEALKLYGSNYKIEPMNSKYVFYNYTDFVLLVDKAQKKVKNIGIVSAKN
ncbi:MAG: hypothetical protein A2104_08550 [Candidatus Melainabacteria bacterium GWF2_32_7]|nr:MAG: hypothetical protein A2104_08550 [Candidatus Melainabacteria bacterium GWF2_32_7]